MASEVVKPLVPSSESQVLKTDCPPLFPGIVDAEAAPEDVVVAAANIRLLRPSFDLHLGLDVVQTGFQVVDEVLLPEMHGRAHVLRSVRRHGMAALPTLQPMMLAVFVPLPIVLGSKLLEAESSRAPIRSGVTLAVLSGEALVTIPTLIAMSPKEPTSTRSS